MRSTGRGPGRPRDPIPRDVILAAAIRVFARDGFGATRLTEVAAEVGITKGALAYHFATKEVLYFEVMTVITRGFSALVRQALEGDGPWLGRLDGLGEGVTAVLGAEPEIARLILRELTDRGPFLAGPGQVALDEVLALVTSFLDEGVRQGRAAPQDTRHLAGTIVLVHVGWFGARGLSTALVRSDPCTPAELEPRRREVVAQIRRLCGAPDR